VLADRRQPGHRDQVEGEVVVAAGAGGLLRLVAVGLDLLVDSKAPRVLTICRASGFCPV